MNLKKNEIKRKVSEALSEDYADNDITSLSLGIKDRVVTGSIIAREEGVICGTELVCEVFNTLNNKSDVVVILEDSSRVLKDDVVLRVKAPAYTLLAGERSALNFLSHLSGIATLTGKYVEAISSFPGARIYDTRKTIPGFRELEKYAVRCGGGYNHRMNLSDQILIKENHLKGSCMGLMEAVRAARKNNSEILIEAETETYEEVIQALEAGADIVMLDDFSLETATEACKYASEKYPKVEIEVSGGINLNTVLDYASIGAGRISVGRITNSAPALDFSLLID